MFFVFRSSPYLEGGRLSDVIAAITAMGTYKFYKLDAAGWNDRISGRQKSPDYWVNIFREHPEFFRHAVESDKFSLVWRRQFPRNYDVDAEKEVSADHHYSGELYDRISRRPLAPSELTSLIGVAISLHQAALSQQNSKRWWIPLVTAALSFIGAVLGVLVSKG